MRADRPPPSVATGIRTLRYPVFWETIAPDSPEHSDWRWHDKHLGRLCQLGMMPIADLLHHGPRDTSLLDPTMPDLLTSCRSRRGALPVDRHVYAGQ